MAVASFANATYDRNINIFLKNGPTPASFSFIFGLFKQTIQFLQQINAKKCPNVHPVSNPRPYVYESSPITTRPGLLSFQHLNYPHFQRLLWGCKCSLKRPKLNEKRPGWPIFVLKMCG